MRSGRALAGMLALLCGAAGCSGPPGPGAAADAIAALPRSVVMSEGVALSYLSAGPDEGRRVLLIHGTPGEAAGWADYLLRVPPGFRFVAVDRPGFGQSGPDGAVVSLARQSAIVAALLDADPGRRTILVGHSLGAPIAVQIALDNPGRVSALVLVAGSLDPAQERIHGAQRIADWPPVRAILPRWVRNANCELMALKPELEAMASRLAELRCPVVIVHGTGDRLVPFANVGFMTQRLTGARLHKVVLEGRNHYLPWNSADEVRAAIATAAGMEGPPC